MPETKLRLLLVDDEEGIRLTLPVILAQAGYEVAVKASVPEALSAINSEHFDILLSDLNIGQPGDGFTLVSAMRRVQPDAVALIITGYPDFEIALDAIRAQVDDFLVKPVTPPKLLDTIRKNLDEEHRTHSASPIVDAADILQANAKRVVDAWLQRVKAEPELSRVSISDRERIDHLPDLVASIVALLRGESEEPSTQQLQTALRHGILRKRQGYTLDMVVEETRLFERCLLSVLQEHLLTVNLSRVIPDIIRITDFVQKLLKHSLAAFTAA